MRKVYRLKHVPTGLYWVKKSYGRLSENGTVFATATNSFSGLGPNSGVYLRIMDDKFIQQHLDVLKRVGELEEVPETKWDMKTCKFIPTGKSHFAWHMTSKVSDFEKEFVTLGLETPEPSVDDKQELIEKVTRACWDQMLSISKDLMPYEDLLKHVKNQLNIG